MELTPCNCDCLCRYV